MTVPTRVEQRTEPRNHVLSDVTRRTRLPEPKALCIILVVARKKDVLTGRGITFADFGFQLFVQGDSRRVTGFHIKQAGKTSVSQNDAFPNASRTEKKVKRL